MIFYGFMTNEGIIPEMDGEIEIDTAGIHKMNLYHIIHYTRRSPPRLCLSQSVPSSKFTIKIP